MTEKSQKMPPIAPRRRCASRVRPRSVGMLPALCLILGLVTGCTSDGSAASVWSDGGTHYSLSGGAVPKSPVPTHSLFGAYLAGNFAVTNHDDQAALGFYNLILRGSSGDTAVAARSLQVAVDAGRFDLAVPLARQIAKNEPGNPLADLVLSVAAFKHGDAKTARTLAAALPNEGLFILFGSLITAWGAIAENPENPVGIDAALAPLARDQQLAGLALVHRALIEDLAGRDGAADHDYRTALGLGAPPLRLIELIGNFWQRTGKRDEAADLYQTFAHGGDGSDGIVPTLSPKPPARLIATPAQGLAEGMFDVAGLAGTANIPDVALLATRLALVLRPDYPQAQFALAESFAARGQFDAARAAYHAVPASAPLAPAARIADVQLLLKMHHQADALALLDTIIAARPTDAEAWSLKGDVLRATGDNEGAIAAYSKALAVVGPSAPNAQLWQLYFSRGAAREQSQHWPEGEADLRRALTYFRDPELLNYLGFALVIRDEKLLEARDMIAKAVALAPNEAAYIDSLGWADYHLHRCAKAKTELEQATQLAAGNAEINDHLGDAYWRCGQKADARLQWRRALGLDPEPDRAKALRAKLDGTALP